MIDFSMKFDTALQLDKDMQTDSTAFHRQGNLPQTDKKENKDFPRFAFLKISSSHSLALLVLPKHHKPTLLQNQKSQSCLPALLLVLFYIGVTANPLINEGK